MRCKAPRSRICKSLGVIISFEDPYPQHLSSGLGHLDEDTIVDLQKTKELQCLALLGVNLVDTGIPSQYVWDQA